MIAIGSIVRVGGKAATVTGKVMVGDDIILVWARLESGAEIRLSKSEIKKMEAKDERHNQAD